MRQSLALLLAAAVIVFMSAPADAGWKWKKMRWESKKAQIYQPPHYQSPYGHRNGYRGPYRYQPYAYGRGHNPYQSFGRRGWDW